MQKVISITKIRDKSNKIVGYTIQSNKGEIKEVKAEDLKKAIINKKIEVLNLTLTSDGRLIDKHIKIKAPTKAKTTSIKDLQMNWVAKIADTVSLAMTSKESQLVDTNNLVFTSQPIEQAEANSLIVKEINEVATEPFCWIITGDIATKRITAGLGIGTHRADKFTRSAIINSEQDLRTFLIILRHIWQDYKDEEKAYREKNE